MATEGRRKFTAELTREAVKLHTPLDLPGNIPTFIQISDSKVNEVNILDRLRPEPGAFYLMNRGFLDFARLNRFHEARSFSALLLKFLGQRFIAWD